MAGAASQCTVGEAQRRAESACPRVTFRFFVCILFAPQVTIGYQDVLAHLWAPLLRALWYPLSAAVPVCYKVCRLVVATAAWVGVKVKVRLEPRAIGAPKCYM